MAVKWTNAQCDAIDSRNGTVLVSAAAGSGKTAVLVQRAISRLTDPENPTPADKLLVVTFTRAAAAEMRARLERRLHEMLRSDPGNETLRRQSILLSQANIGTVHSFCGELIREFFHVLGIAQDFSIVTDKQKEQMQQEALEEVLFDAFGNKSFQKLADAFSSERDDRRLQAVILRIYEYMQSHPYPGRWMGEKVGMYTGDFPAGETAWGKVILEYTAEAAAHCIRLSKEGLHVLRDDSLLYDKMGPVFSEDIACYERLEECARTGEWDRTCYLVKGIAFRTLSALRGYKDDPLKLQASAFRNEAKKIIRGLSSQFTADEKQCKKDFTEISEILMQLRDAALSFSENYQARKRAKNFLDYGDLEHYAIKLLTEGDGLPSAAARQLSKRFDEIMIDEYQDINEVQDKIFQSVSKGGKNLFMVGDVKQSIYGFRCAMPDIFIRCKDSFQKYDRQRDNYPSYIVLDNNFRSRREVTESVNFVFSQIMSRQTADIEYGQEEALVYSANYPKKNGYETELYILRLEKGQNTAEQEAALAAARIRELIESGFTVQDGGVQRTAEYRDFCILLRSTKRHAHVYAASLQRFGIPAKASAAGGFFDAKEIGFMLSLLRVIDNPGQDIPLLSVMMSPVYGFSPDDLAELRARDKKISVYLSVSRAAENHPGCQRLLTDIAMYRSLAATMPSDVFIGYLFERTGYADMVLAMEQGEQRLANLHLLQKYARDYEGAGGNGVAGFVRFMDRLTESRSDIEAATLSVDDNRVSIMSVHKSKGLEFPVCIVAGCGRKLPLDREEVVLHPELGLGIKIRDNTLGARYTSMPREAILLDNRRRDSAEEMRILYVAMTRAKEKLILIGSDKGAEKLLQTAAGEITESGISNYTIRNAGSFLKWLTLCALRHPDGESLRSAAGAAGIGIVRKAYVPWKIELVRQIPSSEAVPDEETRQAEPDEALLRRLRGYVSFVYPHQALTAVPTKVAASALAARRYEQEMGITLTRPAWLSAKGMTPAERGTALHNFMQYADFAKAAIKPEAELDRLVREEFLSGQEADAVELCHVRRFFETELGRMVLRSPDVRKERRFTVEIPADEIMKETEVSPDSTVILQGAVDCTFVYGSKLHIIDFKTDRVKSAEELIVPYREQILLYSRAMRQISDMEIGELYLYSMYTDSFVTVSGF